MKQILKALVPVFVGLVASQFDTIVGALQSLFASNPKVSLVVGSIAVALAYVLKSPFVQAEIKKLSDESEKK